MTDVRTTSSTLTEVASTWGTVVLETHPERSTVRLAGEIDANLSWDAVRRLVQVVRSAHRPVHVDCSAVTFFGSEGLSLLALLEDAAPHGSLADLVTNPVVRVVLDLYPTRTSTHVPGSSPSSPPSPPPSRVG